MSCATLAQCLWTRTREFAGTMHCIMISSFLSILLFAVGTAAAGPERVELCRVLSEPGTFGGEMIEIHGYVEPSMQGTHLLQEGCDQALPLILPEEIPYYKGTIKTVKDAHFEAFQKFRSHHKLDTPRYSA